MISITNSKLQYKANDGGVTRRIPEHFVKRSVQFEINGEERRIHIGKDKLSISASEDEVVNFITNNLDSSLITNEQLEKLKQADLDNKEAIAELYMLALGGM